jgi:hypothetical protein
MMTWEHSKSKKGHLGIAPWKNNKSVNPFSSPFWGEKCSILATRPVFVTILGWKKLNFGGETRSRHHFGVRNSIF